MHWVSVCDVSNVVFSIHRLPRDFHPGTSPFAAAAHMVAALI
jgi:hypothetical protein